MSEVYYKYRPLFNSITHSKMQEHYDGANGSSCLSSLLVSQIYCKSKVESHIVSTENNVYSLSINFKFTIFDTLFLDSYAAA